LINDFTKEKDSSKYTVTLDENMEHVVEGALRALQFIKAISNLQGPFPVRKLSARHLDAGDNIHLDTLLEAFDRLQRAENHAAMKEGMSPICHRIAFWRIEGTSQLYIVGIEFGHLHDTQFKPAYILQTGEFTYELEWK
jgi:hypothetical protein